MPNIVINSNGTIEGTTLTVDGKEISKKEKIIGIDFFAMAPYKSQYSGETMPGNVGISYDKANEDGTIKKTYIYSGPDRSVTGIGKKIKNSDQVVRYIDRKADNKVVDLVDEIVDHYETANLQCPDKETLLSRSIESLKDKIDDLGIKIFDAKSKYYAVKASETTGDQPKYPINNCNDVKDAWKLRSHGKGLKISQDKLESRIKRRARALGCPVPGDNSDNTDEKKSNQDGRAK